jgi:hypothetical protein
VRLLAGRGGSAGPLIGLAAACKATPLLWCPYLLLRRRILAGVLVGVVAVGGNLLPDLVATPPGGGTWMERWVARYVLPTQRLDAPLGSWASAIIFNQSLGGTIQRLVNTEPAFRGGAFEIAERVRVSPFVLKLVSYLIFALMIAVSIAVPVWTSIRTAGAASGSPLMFEFGMVMMLMLLLSPMSSKAHFVTLLLPGFCLARRAFVEGDRLIGGVVVAAALIGIVSNKDPLGAAVYGLLLWSGAITLATLLLWLGCLLAIVRGARIADATPRATAQPG